MSRENPTLGVPRIQAELHLLGYEIAGSTVAKYRVRVRQWKSFLRNHAGQIAAIDFFSDFQYLVLLRCTAARQKARGPLQCDGPSDCPVDRTADH